jgi:hypothetical protein
MLLASDIKKIQYLKTYSKQSYMKKGSYVNSPVNTYFYKFHYTNTGHTVLYSLKFTEKSSEAISYISIEGVSRL